MKFRMRSALVCMAVAFSMTGAGDVVRADQAAKISASGALTTLAAAPADGMKLSLLVAGEDKPVAVALSADSQLGGICVDCMLFQTFKPDAITKACMMCGCGSPNADCVSWAHLKTPDLVSFFKALPKGVGLRASYVTADKPDSGVKTLYVDRRTVLLPVDGLSSQTPDQLTALVKPFDGTKAELMDGGKQLVIHLKDDWTSDKEAKFEQALTKSGGKIVDADTAATTASAAH